MANRLIVFLALASAVAMAMADAPSANVQTRRPPYDSYDKPYGGQYHGPYEKPYSGAPQAKAGYSNLVYSPTNGVTGSVPTTIPAAGLAYCPGDLGVNDPIGCWIINDKTAESACPADQPIAISCDCTCSVNGEQLDGTMVACRTQIGVTPGKCQTVCADTQKAFARAICGPKTVSGYN